MSITKRISLSALAIFTLVALVGPVIGQANWTPAPGTPPEGNPSPPIHTGDEYQEKNGVLKALGLITRTLDVFINGTYTGSVLKIRENTTKFPNYNDYAVSIATYGAVGGNNGRKGGLIVQAGWSNTTSTIAQFSALTSGYLEVPRMTILSSGRVGIGTTSPDTQINDADGNKVGDVLLHVTEWIKAKGLRADDIIVDNLTVNDNFYFEDYLLGFWKKVSSESPHIYYDEGGVVVGDTGARNPIQSIYGGIGKLTVYDGDIWLTNKAVTSDKITKTYYYQLLAEHISRESVGTYTNANDSTYRCPFDIEQNNDEGLSTVGNCTLIGNDNDPQYDDLIETYIDYGLPKEITIYDEGYTPYTSFASMKPRGERDNEVFCYDWYEDQGPRAKYYEVFVRQTSAEEQFFPGIGSLAFFDQKNEPYAGYISADDGKIKLGQGFRHFQDQGNFDKPDMYLGNLNPFMTINYRVSDNTKIGNIGIGTVDPQERFHVVGRTRLVGELNSFGGANFLQGRVGIGTSSPARNLHIFSNSSDPVLAVERRDSTDSTKDGALLFI
ncbi:MAG TPA: hypothetical protein ENN31_00390, partial [Candidatus Vogelbacteria bacterium]|nr:hypothetical protein [Candidatus Vogelbacteria bacterium]